MDYPKSVPGVGLVDGKFVNEDSATGQIGSLIPAQWGNAVTDEIINSLKEFGVTPNESNNAQLAAALRAAFLSVDKASALADEKKVFGFDNLGLIALAKTLITNNHGSAPASVTNWTAVVNLFSQLFSAIGTPTGAIIAYGGVDVPEGFLLCNGANVSRTTYANLFAKIGTRFGAGDGSTTFTLPNMNGRVLQGVTDVSKVGQYLAASLPNITGALGYLYSYANGGVVPVEEGSMFYRYHNEGDNVRYSATNLGTNTYADPSFIASRSSSIYSGETVQPASAQTLMIIKA